MNKLQKFLIGLFVVLGFGGGVYVVNGQFSGGGYADLNRGDIVLMRGNPDVGRNATMAQLQQLVSIQTAMVIYRSDGVYAPFK